MKIPDPVLDDYYFSSTTSQKDIQNVFEMYQKDLAKEIREEYEWLFANFGSYLNRTDTKVEQEFYRHISIIEERIKEKYER